MATVNEKGSEQKKLLCPKTTIENDPNGIEFEGGSASTAWVMHGEASSYGTKAL